MSGTPDLDGIMKSFFKGLLEKWKTVAAKIAAVQTTIILFILYFGVFSIMSLLILITRKDLLDKRLVPVRSYWKNREPAGRHPDQYNHQF